MQSGISWLQAWHAEDGLRIGCLPCYRYLEQCPDVPAECRLTESTYANFELASVSSLKPSNLRRHADSPGHALALAIYEGKTPPTEELAPPASSWRSLWALLRKKRQTETPATEALGRGKVRLMLYCLAEAIRQRHREQLHAATCVTLSMDVAKTRLLVRFSAVTAELVVRRGVLGMKRSKETGHQSILGLLKSILANAATSLCGAPLNGNSPVKEEPWLDHDLYEHLRSTTVVWNSDAAGDEMLAAQESQRTPASLDDLLPLFPNLTFVNRDKAHASRRVAQRPWTAAPELTEVFKTFCSWFKTIQFSPLLQGWFEHFQAEAEEEQLIKVQSSLSHAAHRFDSTSRPFAICALTFRSVLLTAIKAWTQRKNDPQGKAAYPFLDFISGPEGASRMVLAGMLADAMDEAMQLTRAFDREATDTALLHSHLQRFLKNTATLFIAERCVETGFTSLMRQHAKTQSIWIDKNHPRTIGVHGGLSAAVLAQNLKHMAAWTGLASKVIAAEFPSFDLMCCFRILALSGMGSGDASREHLCKERADMHTEDLARLCRALQIDVDCCRHEFTMLVGVAEAQKEMHRCTNLEAWQHAVQVTRRSRARYSLDGLGPLLEAYAAWVCSSSGVEQNFSVRDWLSSKRRPVAEQRELDELQIHVEDIPDEENLFQEASDIWARLYGKPRATGHRLRGYFKTSKMLAADAPVALKTWIQERRSQVEEFIAAENLTGDVHVETVAGAAQRQAAEKWTARHDAEAHRQETVSFEKQVDAAHRGHLLDHELTPDLQWHADHLEEEENRRRCQREQEAHRFERRMARPVFCLFGKTVCLRFQAPDPSMDRVLVQYNMRRATPTEVVDLFVVPDIACVGQAVQLLAYMYGSMIGTVEFLQSGGSAGAVAGYLPAISMQKHIYISDAFAAAYPALDALLRQVLDMPTCSWKAIDTLAAWLRLQIHRKEASKYLALVTKAEKESEGALNEHKYFLTLEGFLQHIQRLDHDRTALG
ncbi:unnamed protein product [Symbiodinium microadriaticum]|nr:unnamed protein product [Symbiodinium microadriaticum]